MTRDLYVIVHPECVAERVSTATRALLLPSDYGLEDTLWQSRGMRRQWLAFRQKALSVETSIDVIRDSNNHVVIPE